MKTALEKFSSGAQRAITGSMLYSLVSCPHRVTMDVYADPTQRDPVNAFVEMLWERGSSVERERMAALDVSFVDLQAFTTTEKTRKTRAALWPAPMKPCPLMRQGPASSVTGTAAV